MPMIQVRMDGRTRHLLRGMAKQYVRVHEGTATRQQVADYDANTKAVAEAYGPLVDALVLAGVIVVGPDAEAMNRGAIVLNRRRI